MRASLPCGQFVGDDSQLSAAATAQKVRLGELLEKQAVTGLGQELVNSRRGVIKDAFRGLGASLDQLANQVVTVIETTDNEDPKNANSWRHRK